MTITITNPKILQLEAELAAEKQRESGLRHRQLWKIVNHLSNEDLKILGRMIHVHFYGDGEDD